jgi:penicillin-binding protein 2
MREMRSEHDLAYEQKVQTRIRIAYVLALLAFALLCLRLWLLQVVEGDTYRRLSENNRIRTQIIKSPRGCILDSRAKVLASNRPSFDICLVPQETSHAADVLQDLADLVTCDVSQLRQKAQQARGRPPYEPVKLLTDVSRDMLALVLTHKLDLPGIIVETTPVRHYPAASRACHLLGHLGEINPRQLQSPVFAGYKPGTFIGKCGVEQVMEQDLKGTDGGYQAEVDATGYKVNIMGRVDPIPAYNVILTIDADLQQAADEALAGKTGAIVAVDPRDGRILAMASSPPFDPNLFSRSISAKEWGELMNNPSHPLMNRCIQTMQPPGSTYKLITAAAALSEQEITTASSFTCNGFLAFGSRPYRCWRKTGHGTVALERGIVESCDVYFYQLGIMLGPDRLARYARGFGLGELTGIGLSEEKKGLIPTSDWYQRRYGIPWQRGESLSIAIGQGANLVTPLQLVMAYASLANGGTVYQPFFIAALETADRKPVKQFSPRVRASLPLSKETINCLKECLFKVVNTPAGTGTRAHISGRDVCGKTGTAQVINLGRDSRSPRNSDLQDHAWFVAFAPKDNARIAVVAFVEHGGHGGSAAAPLVQGVIARFFQLEAPGD